MSDATKHGVTLILEVLVQEAFSILPEPVRRQGVGLAVKSDGVEIDSLAWAISLFGLCSLDSHTSKNLTYGPFDSGTLQ